MVKDYIIINNSKWKIVIENIEGRLWIWIKKYLYYLIAMHLFYIINVANMYKTKYGGENGRISEAG